MKSDKTMLSERQSGFSMIEVLIAVLILAVGLLGVAGVQVVSMQNTANANLRSQATILAQDMAERIRANGNALLSDTADDAWESRLTRKLGPGAQAEITANGDVIQIRLQWVERDASVTEEGGEDSPGKGRSRQTFDYRLEV